MNHKSILLSLCAIAAYSSVANAGIIHDYSFAAADPASPTVIKDKVGSVDARLKGDAKIVNGQLVLANADKTSADDSMAYVEFASSVLPKGNDATLVIWFGAKDVGTYARLINIGTKQDAVGSAFIYFTPRTADDQSRVAISATDTASKTALNSDRLDDDKVHMATIVIDGAAKKLHLYVDGKAKGDAVDLGDNTLDKVKPVQNMLGRSSFDQDPALSGSIAAFSVYDNAMKADEVATAYGAGVKGQAAGEAVTQPAR